MKAMFVNSDGCIPYADAIVNGYKTIETRSRNMLSALVGERVAVVRTGRGKNPMVVGYVTIGVAVRVPYRCFGNLFDLHCVPPGSKYDCKTDGYKWCYALHDAEKCEPYPLPKDAIRHGRSWCVFEEV